MHLEAKIITPILCTKITYIIYQSLCSEQLQIFLKNILQHEFRLYVDHLYEFSYVYIEYRKA